MEGIKDKAEINATKKKEGLKKTQQIKGTDRRATVTDRDIKGHGNKVEKRVR